MNITEEIGNRIRYYRKEKDLSQEELALQSDLHSSYIGQLERGVKTPSVSTIYKITKGLDITMSELLSNIEILDTNSGIVSATDEDSYALKAYMLIEQESGHDQKTIYEIIKKVLEIKPKNN